MLTIKDWRTLKKDTIKLIKLNGCVHGTGYFGRRLAKFFVIDWFWFDGFSKTQKRPLSLYSYLRICLIYSFPLNADIYKHKLLGKTQTRQCNPKQVNLSWLAAVHPEAVAELSSPDALPATQIGPFRFQLVQFLPPGDATRCFPVLSRAATSFYFV